MPSTASTRCSFPAHPARQLAASPGYPTVIVPFGDRAQRTDDVAFPAGFDAKPAPFGVSFTGLACSEPRLHRARLRLRAGDEAARAAAGRAVGAAGTLGGLAAGFA